LEPEAADVVRALALVAAAAVVVEEFRGWVFQAYQDGI
jgi:hypothetical protein